LKAMRGQEMFTIPYCRCSFDVVKLLTWIEGLLYLSCTIPDSWNTAGTYKNLQWKPEPE
jgi:hypothetical protein